MDAREFLTKYNKMFHGAEDLCRALGNTQVVEVSEVSAEVALYFAEQDVFDDEDLDPLSDEWEAAEFEANAGDR